ncbi:hypothetical protein OpiT1DRAFT_05622 [Opitutaceae bacterium TAV1]|nr:hypothetical protein OpiT1DRAFT_05622 [Opitutaceae bacterium TAV1]
MNWVLYIFAAIGVFVTASVLGCWLGWRIIHLVARAELRRKARLTASKTKQSI